MDWFACATLQLLQECTEYNPLKNTYTHVNCMRLHLYMNNNTKKQGSGYSNGFQGQRELLG